MLTIELFIIHKHVMGNEQKAIVPNERWMYNCFVHYNREYFDNSLPIPKFSTECDSSLWGSYAPEFFYDTNSRRVVDIRGNGTIKLNGMYKRTVDSWVLTLLHEMAHEYMFMVMKVYPENPHGREFEAIAKYIRRKSGGVWNITEPTEKVSTDMKVRKRR